MAKSNNGNDAIVPYDGNKINIVNIDSDNGNDAPGNGEIESNNGNDAIVPYGDIKLCNAKNKIKRCNYWNNYIEEYNYFNILK